MLTLFWVSFAIVTYVYFGYPILLRLGLLGRPKKVWRGFVQPRVSVIVPAHNEENIIEAKIANLLGSDYPRERVEILIGSDGSSDRTEEIVRSHAPEGVGLVSFPQQQGKSAMQNGLVACASGEILVFTDADCLSPPGTLRCLIENFADSRVGLVTARPLYQNENETNVARNESLYLRYETWLREQESERGLLAMASGSLFAMRRSLWRPLDLNLGDDFVFPLQVIQARSRNVLETRAVAFTRLTQDHPASMFRWKVRIISKDFRAVLVYRDLLNIFRFGGAAAGLWSHKLLRWLVPYLLIGIFVSNVFLLNRHIYGAFFLLQTAFYSMAVAGFAMQGRGTGSVWSVPMSFCVVNLAALLGTLKCFAGQTTGRWEPHRKPSAAL